MGVDLTKAPNNFVSGDVKIGREGRRDGRGHIGRMDNLGIKAGCKKRVKHHSFIRV